jgi:hypothetical protein
MSAFREESQINQKIKPKKIYKSIKSQMYSRLLISSLLQILMQNFPKRQQIGITSDQMVVK